jgi:hypothetical protein
VSSCFCFAMPAFSRRAPTRCNVGLVASLRVAARRTQARQHCNPDTTSHVRSSN